MFTKKIDLGQYKIEINHDTDNGELDISVYDELDELVESITIFDIDDDDDNDNDTSLSNDFNINLN